MTIDQLLSELEAMLAARRERKMGDYKVVPVVSTSEMDIAGTESGAGIELNRHDAELVWSAMIAAAPAVQADYQRLQADHKRLQAECEKLRKLLAETVEDRDDAEYSLGLDLVERINAAMEGDKS